MSKLLSLRKSHARRRVGRVGDGANIAFGFTKDSVLISANDKSSHGGLLCVPKLSNILAYQPLDCIEDIACKLSGADAGREIISPKLASESVRLIPVVGTGVCARQSYKSDGTGTENPPRFGLGASKDGTTPSSSIDLVGSGVLASRAAPYGMAPHS